MLRPICVKKIEVSNANILCEALPTIECDLNQIARVFYELINNSIKFKQEELNPVIKITYEETFKDYLITYTDNGIGVDINKPDRIFNIFYSRKLKTNNPACENCDEECLGIGLTITKRIIERHNGSILFEPAPNGQGSQFIIKLPMPLSHQH